MAAPLDYLFTILKKRERNRKRSQSRKRRRRLYNMYKEYRLNRRSLLEQVVFRDGLTCTRCGLAFESKRDRRLTIDHKLPISKGGNHISIANMQLLCKDCHEKKDQLPPKRAWSKTADPSEAIPALLFDWLLERVVLTCWRMLFPVTCWPSIV